MDWQDEEQVMDTNECLEMNRKKLEEVTLAEVDSRNEGLSGQDRRHMHSVVLKRKLPSTSVEECDYGFSRNTYRQSTFRKNWFGSQVNARNPRIPRQSLSPPSGNESSGIERESRSVSRRSRVPNAPNNNFGHGSSYPVRNFENAIMPKPVGRSQYYSREFYSYTSSRPNAETARRKLLSKKEADNFAMQRSIDKFIQSCRDECDKQESAKKRKKKE